MQDLLDDTSRDSCSFIVESNNKEERQRLSNLKAHCRPSYLKPLTAYLQPVLNSTVKLLLSKFLVLDNNNPKIYVNAEDLVRLHQRTVICIRTGRVYHSSGKCQQFICDFYTERDYWLGNRDILLEARRETRRYSDSLGALNADLFKCKRGHQTLMIALQYTEKQFEAQR